MTVTSKLLLAPVVSVSAAIHAQRVQDVIRDLGAMSLIVEDNDDLTILDAINGHLAFVAKDLELLRQKYGKVAAGG